MRYNYGLVDFTFVVVNIYNGILAMFAAIKTDTLERMANTPESNIEPRFGGAFDKCDKFNCLTFDMIFVFRTKDIWCELVFSYYHRNIYLGRSIATSTIIRSTGYFKTKHTEKQSYSNVYLRTPVTV